MLGHFIEDDEITIEGSETGLLKLARVVPADPADVAMVLAQPTTGHDGRSEWVWLRLRDGTLALATFPQGDTYMEISETGKAPFYD